MPSTDSPAPAGKRPALLVGFIVLTILLVAGDLALKRWAQTHLPGEKAVLLIPNVLALQWVENHGAIFGLGQGHRWVFIVATVFALAVVGYVFATSRAHQHVLHVVLVLILAGALGNLWDRVSLGFVRDMLWLFPGVKLPLGGHWPQFLGGGDELYPWVFNAADAYLCVGIVLAIIRSLVSSKSKFTDEQAEPSNAKSSPGDGV